METDLSLRKKRREILAFVYFYFFSCRLISLKASRTVFSFWTRSWSSVFRVNVCIFSVWQNELITQTDLRDLGNQPSAPPTSPRALVSLHRLAPEAFLSLSVVHRVVYATVVAVMRGRAVFNILRGKMDSKLPSSSGRSRKEFWYFFIYEGCSLSSSQCHTAKCSVWISWLVIIALWWRIAIKRVILYKYTLANLLGTPVHLFIVTTR